jgi:hypothetical protein
LAGLRVPVAKTLVLAIPRDAASIRTRATTRTGERLVNIRGTLSS